MQNGGRFDEADEQFLFGKTCGDIDGGDGGQVQEADRGSEWG